MSDDHLRNALREGYVLHWYRIERVLGQGGFGITYLARDTNLDQYVAVKEYLPLELAVREGDFSVYPASQAQGDRYRWGLDRFLAEARNLARFRHPAIVRVLSVFEANNTAYMVMEYQHGRSLQAIIERHRTLPESELLGLLEPLLDGLDAMHAQGFIHRDIKPPNLFVREDGQPVLLDFGSARQALGQQVQTLTSVVSPGYAPFEQYYSKGDRQGPWTDIYGLGATLYRCISGVQPMPAIDRSEAILRAERDLFVPADEIGAGRYSPGFLSAIDAALAFDPGRRPQSVAAWRAMFDFAGRAPLDDTRLAEVPPNEDNATTRFSAIADESFDVTTGASFGPDGSGPRPPSGERRGRSGPRSAPRPASGERRERSAPPSAPGPRSRPVAAPATGGLAPPKRAQFRLFAAVLVAIGVLASGGGWWLLQGGRLPEVAWFGADERSLERLVAQGDRALAAGNLHEPPGESALAFYARALAQAPDDAQALHGMRIVGQRLGQAVRAALAAGDLATAEALAAHLAEVPPKAFDAGALGAELGEARAAAAARASQAARIDEFLRAAADDVAAGRLLGSGSDNALAKYRAVQILDPGNARAATGVTELAGLLATQAESALAAGDLDAADAAIAQARMLDATVSAYAELAQQVDDARAQRAAARGRAEEIAELLESAADDARAGRLSDPPGKNAVERYRRVLALDPGNAQAARGIERIQGQYLADGRAALVADDVPRAERALVQARAVKPDSDGLVDFERALDGTRARLEVERAASLAQELAAEQEAAARAAAAAEAERRRLQDAEATRLYAEAKRKAAEEEAVAQAARAQVDAARRAVLDFHGFDPRYRSYFLTPDRVQAAVEPALREAGYTVVSRQSALAEPGGGTRLIVFRLHINVNSATGLYSYAGSVNVFGPEALALSAQQALAGNPLWTLGHNGLGPPSDLRWMLDHYEKLTRAWLANQPDRRQ